MYGVASSEIDDNAAVARKRDTQAEATRTLRLLWRAAPDPHPGPVSALGIDELVSTAIELADAEGLSKLSMRRLASELGISAMSVYTHVASKAELLELMSDAAYGELAGEPHTDRRWQDRVAAIARENLELFSRHAWLLEQPPGRPPLGPGTTGKYERELMALDGLGLDDVELDSALSFVVGFSRGAARDSLAARAASEHTEDAAWWAQRAEALERLMPAEDYPLAVRVGSAAGAAHEAAWDARMSFDFGLERVIDGLARLIERKSRAEDAGCR